MSKLSHALIAMVCAAVLPAATSQAADVILNEYNAVDGECFLGVCPAVNPQDDTGSDPFWGTRLANGGDWFELVVITDLLDMRGWEIVITNETGEGPPDEESWSFVLSQHEIWNGLRSGTILTISQQLGNDFGDYNPAVGRWWLNIRADVDTPATYLTFDCVDDPGCTGEDRNWKVSNNRWQIEIFDDVGSSVFGPAGEGVQPMSGVTSHEIVELEADPSATITPTSGYDDGDSSTFGLPNGFAGTVQDFSVLRDAAIEYSPLTDVVITEVLSHSDPGEDWIEIMNTTDAEIDVGGWFISDDWDDLQRYEIPAGTMIGPRGYLTFTQSELLFGFSAPCGEQAILSEGDGAGMLTGRRDYGEFRALESGRTVGRPLSDPGAPFVRLADPSMGAGNAQPAAGPVVINEIMYNPDDEDDPEYVELHNITDATVNLFTDYGVDGTYPWKITGGIDYEFDTSQTIDANGYLLVVDFDPIADPSTLALFQANFAIPAGTPIVGPYSGGLSNFSDDLRLRMPDTPEDDENICGPAPMGATNFVPYVVVDEVEYFDFGAWPVEPDGIGASLERINPYGIGDDPSNWVANLLLTASPGAANTTAGTPGKAQQKCVNALNKDFAKVVKAQNKEASSCFKNESRGSLGAQTVDECLLADPRGKVLKATDKTLADHAKNCTGNDNTGISKVPYVGARDGAVVNAAAIDGSVAVMEDVYGLDLDAGIVDSSSDSELSKCQLGVAKTLTKCVDTHVKEFTSCKKNGLKSGSIASSADLAACVGADTKGKIAKTCDSNTGKLGNDLVNRCTNVGVDVLAAFPGCGSSSPSIVLDCLEGRAACRACLAMGEADDTYPDCDLVDNGVDDDTCP